MRAGEPHRFCALGGDRQRRDGEIGAVGQQRRDALWAGHLHQFELDAQIFGKLTRRFDLGAGRLVVLVEDAERRRRHLGGDADFLVLQNAVECLRVRRLGADRERK